MFTNQTIHTLGGNEKKANKLNFIDQTEFSAGVFFFTAARRLLLLDNDGFGLLLFPPAASKRVKWAIFVHNKPI